MTTTRDSPRIVVVGSVMVDLITYADPLPQAGQTVRGSGFRIGSGGKGANQAVTAHRLGSEVSFVARVGTDIFGELSIHSLEEQGIDTTRVRRVEGLTTGAAPIWVQEDGTNRIIVVPGANDALSPKEVATDLASLTQADCLVCQLEIPEDAVVEALKLGRNLNAVTILNPAPAPVDLGAARIFPYADWLIPNEHEFELLWGSKPSDEAILSAAAHWCCGVIVTLGEEGAAGTVDGDVVRRRPPPVRVADTTGAGDAFVGGLAHGLGSGMALVAAMELGNVCGALSTESFGTQASFPTRDAVDRIAGQGAGSVAADLEAL